jgi:cob(I)alamin adenosyltransferase
MAAATTVPPGTTKPAGSGTLASSSASWASSPSTIAAAIDLARTLVRRAERRAVSLQRAGLLENREVLRYLNRLSDLLFMLAREAEQGATSLRHPADS